MSLLLLDQRSLDEVAARAAPALAALGLTAGTSVAVVARNRPELLVVDAAAALQGASVAHIDPDGSAIDADRALAEARPSVVVCEHAEQIPFVRTRAPGSAVVVLAGTGTPGAVVWPQVVGDVGPAARPTGSAERVLCDAHLSVSGSGDALRLLLRDGASVALAPPAADRQAVLALRPTTLLTTAARIDGLARELRRRAPLRRGGDRRALRWAALAALPSLTWAVSSALALGSAGARATSAALAALAFAAAALAAGRRRPVVLAVAAGAALSLACDAAGSAPSLVAAGRFTAATLPAAALIACLASASREVAWAQAVVTTRCPESTRRSPVGIVRTGIGRFIATRVRAAVSLPACRQVLVVGDAPDEVALAELAVARLAIAPVDLAVPAASPRMLMSTAGEVG